MNSPLFIDSNFFCALYNNIDSLHLKAKLLAPSLKDTQLVISNFVLLETYTVLSQRASKKRALQFGNHVANNNPYDIFWIDRNLEDEVWKIFSSIKDKNFSYVDASILAVLKKEKIHHVLSFDSGFKKQEKEFNFSLIGA